MKCVKLGAHMAFYKSLKICSKTTAIGQRRNND